MSVQEKVFWSTFQRLQRQSWNGKKITIIRWVWAASWYWIQILLKVSFESNLKIYQNWASLRIPLKQRFEMFVLSVWKYLERIFPELAPGRRLHKPPTPHSAAGKPGGGAELGTWRFSTPVGFRTPEQPVQVGRKATTPTRGLWEDFFQQTQNS